MDHKSQIFIFLSIFLITQAVAQTYQELFIESWMDTLNYLNFEKLFKFITPSFLVALAKFSLEWIQEDSLEQPDEKQLFPEYDFIIVGAGTSGCVVANRLTENPEWTVLLIEAGESEKFIYDIPLAANYLQQTDLDWQYKTQPDPNACLAHKNGQCNWPRGKVMGGSSVLNSMIYTRGSRHDYNRWAELGNEGWSYEDVLPYFKKLEDFTIDEEFNSRYHNHGGPVSISHNPNRTKLAETFVDAAKLLGYKYVDYNGATQIGISFLQTSTKNGTRHSSNRAYLHNLNRPNLHVVKLTHVTKVLIDENKRTRGVEMLRDERIEKVYARKEVILSSGTINTPQILMLSGIGPRDQLTKFNIPIISELKVGYNLQDHWASGGLIFLVNESITLKSARLGSDANHIQEFFENHSGPFSIAGGCEAIIFDDLTHPKDSNGHANLEILLASGSLTGDRLLRHDFGVSDYIYETVYKPIEEFDSFMLYPMILLPKSRGRIKLASKNPLDKPLIYAGYYSNPEDLEIFVAGSKKILEIINSPPFQKFNTRPNPIPLPPCQHLEYLSDEYFRCHARQLVFTIYHHVGTAKMGPDNDPNAVVNPRLKVRGVQGLRVIDASIMPLIPAGHTNSPAFMIGEKGADLIKQDWGLFVHRKRQKMRKKVSNFENI